MESIFDTSDTVTSSDQSSAPVVKAYVCNKWPYLKIGNDQVQFHKGKFETADPTLQALVESSNDFGRYIIPQQ